MPAFRRIPRYAVAVTFAAAAIVLAPHSAIAGPEIGVDGEAIVPLHAPTGDKDSLDSGAGFKVRLIGCTFTRQHGRRAKRTREVNTVCSGRTEGRVHRAACAALGGSEARCAR